MENREGCPHIGVAVNRKNDADVISLGKSRQRFTNITKTFAVTLAPMARDKNCLSFFIEVGKFMCESALRSGQGQWSVHDVQQGVDNGIACYKNVFSRHAFCQQIITRQLRWRV